MFALGTRTLTSVDLGYHLAYGEHALTTGELVDHNPYLYTLPRLDLPLPNSYRLVEQGQLSKQAYRAFVFDEVVRLHTRLNPNFFAGTSVEDAIASDC